MRAKEFLIIIWKHFGYKRIGWEIRNAKNISDSAGL